MSPVVIYSNAAFEAITGYTSEESIAKNCRFLQGDDRDQENVKKIKKAVRDRRPIHTRIVNYTKSGKLFYNEISTSPIYNRSGALIHYLGIQHDVTEKVLAEQRIDGLNRQMGFAYAIVAVAVVGALGMAAWALSTHLTN